MSKTNEVRLDNLFQSLSTELLLSPKRDDPAVQRQLQRMRKRAKYNRPSLEQDGLDQFEITNFKVGLTELALPNDIVSNASWFIQNAIWNYNTNVNPLNIQEDLDMGHLFDQWRFGPGASNEVKGTHTAEKLYEKMTCTRLAEPLVSKLRKSHHYLSVFDTLNENNGLCVISGSKLTTVPKNEDSVRIIAIEPSGNMCLQLAAGSYLTGILRRIGLDISTQQEKNKFLAEIGSKDNSLATIDLSKASDMFKPELIRALFPTKWYDLLMKIRSPFTTIGGRLVRLNMISTMGNGFTFPLMTLCIVSLIYAMRCRKNGPTLFLNWDRTAVFGDDIIIPSTEYGALCELLESAGLVVNHDKSYYDGPFRESCGGDFWLGRDITPFYAKSLSCNAEIYVVINQIVEWTLKHKVCVLQTLKKLLAMLDGDPFFVPEWMNPDQGILIAEVDKRYKFLQLKKHEVKLRNEFFALPLISGGYVSSRGPDIIFTPRQNKTRYVVRRGRIPKGYLSGYDPRKRTASDSAAVSRLFFFLRP